VALAWHCLSFEALVRLVGRAEALGYDAAFVDGDVSQLGGANPRAALEGWTVTTALLARTRRIGIGSIRLVHHWNGARLAQAVATAEAIFPGRLRFLISIGGHAIDRAFGLPFPGVGERVRWLDEMLPALRALWAGERTSTTGRYVRLEGAIVRPTPPPGLPRIAVAARAPSLLKVVARHADLWDVNLPPVRRRVEAAAAELARACEALGRDPAGIGRSQWIFARAGRVDPDAARSEFRRLNPWFASIPDAELREGLVLGSPGECRDRLAEIRGSLRIDLPIVDLSGLPEGEASAQIEALAPA
jgi:alkanesulfonate monooxygenase SsuD/methylene tetrahydromethanopterin reductase-like flavin-dependent oxidoreductase (luciferase family)